MPSAAFSPIELRVRDSSGVPDCSLSRYSGGGLWWRKSTEPLKLSKKTPTLPSPGVGDGELSRVGWAAAIIAGKDCGRFEAIGREPHPPSPLKGGKQTGREIKSDNPELKLETRSQIVCRTEYNVRLV